MVFLCFFIIIMKVLLIFFFPPSWVSGEFCAEEAAGMAALFPFLPHTHTPLMQDSRWAFYFNMNTRVINLPI